MVAPIPIPSPDLIYLVSGHRDVETWAKSRRAAVEVILSTLEEADINASDFRSVLDFGCGCGRILAGWQGLTKAKLYGVDIEPELVAFCQKNLDADVRQCAAYPPLEFSVATFDFVYAASVWTHMVLAAAVQWAGEMARIVKPGGFLMVSWHGSAYGTVLANLSPDAPRMLDERGIYVHCHSRDAYEGSNDYATFMTADFVRSLFKGFDLIRLRRGADGPTHFAAEQDIGLFHRWPS